jgi:hypothetical protein
MIGYGSMLLTRAVGNKEFAWRIADIGSSRAFVSRVG